MNWSESIVKAIEYIENNLTNDITVEDIANHLYMSSFYFQKGFSIVCGYGVSEYIRNRKLSLAGYEILHTNNKIIDIALKYGYDSPDSFTKAFTRFHGSTPTEVRRGGKVREFAPLKINLIVKGGYTMEYKIEERERFKVIGLKSNLKYETASIEIPKVWTTFFKKNPFSRIKPKYAVNFDNNMSGDTFDYMICDDYNEDMKITKGFEVVEIPKFTWVIFSCIGPSNIKMPEINEKIFKEWLPNSTEYKIAAGYNIEMYSNPNDYKKGVNDEQYYAEIWIPIKKK